MILPTNVSDICAAVKQMLLEHPNIGNLNVAVERAAEPPEIPGIEGWVGVYKGTIQYPSRTLGMGAGFRQQRVKLALHVLMSNYESGEECEVALEGLLQNCVSCLLSDTSLRGTVEVLDTDFEVQYPDFIRGDNVWIQSASIFFIGLVNVSWSED
jgi:hypothetical protein